MKKDAMSRILSEETIKPKKIKNEVISLYANLSLDIEWNGSRINDPSDNIIWTERISGIDYCHIKLDEDNIIYAEIKQSQHLLTVIIDEIKPIFGLNKLGTLWFKYGGHFYILMKVDIYPESHEIVTRKNLKKFKIKSLDQKLLHEVRKIFIFKEILGINSNTEKNILILNNDDIQIAVSNNECSIKKGENESCLSDTICQKWFKDLDTNIFIQEMVKVHHPDRVSSKSFKIYEKIVNVIERIDRKLITFADLVKLRLLTKLQSCFKC